MFKMYSSLAHLWPALNPLEEYSEEAYRLRQLISPYILSVDTPSMVEFGSGGGRLLNRFTGEFQTNAVDLSPEMILQSKKLNPSTNHTVGDMRTINLDQQFDVVLIGDSVGYAVSERDLELTIGNGRAHLKEDGVMILTPDWTEETFTTSNVWSRRAKTGSGEVALVEYQHRVNSAARSIRSAFVFIITEDGSITVEIDHHTFGLHAKSVWGSVIGAAQLLGEVVPFLDNEYGLSKEAFVCKHSQ